MSRHPRTQVLAEGFAAWGDRVDWCNVPLDLDTAARVRLLRQPWRAATLPGSLGGAWAALARKARRLPPPDAVVVGYLGHVDVHLARRLHPGVPIVLDHLIGLGDTAVDRGAEAGWLVRALAAADAAAVRAADVVVVDTEGHRDLLPDQVRDRAEVVDVGAPHVWFAAQVAAARHPRPWPRLRVVFFGLFTPLQGTPTIAAALRRLCDERVELDALLAGDGQDAPRVQSLLGDAPVERRAWVDAAELPATVAAHDVCLGIFGTSQKARRVVPNKVFQGAAAGCAVVTSDTPPQRARLGDDAVRVPPGDADALAATLAALAEDPGRVAALRAAAVRRSRAHFLPAVVVSGLRARVAAAAGGDR